MEKNQTEENVLYYYIDTSASLASLIQLLKTQNLVALDTEADSFHHYQTKVCLIQLSFEENTYIVDPLTPIDIHSLLEVLANKELIIHDAGYDLRLLYADFGFRPRNGIFDTKLAAALAGMDKVGLSDVLHHITGMKVAKHNQRANWSKRPLAEHLLRYAAEDTASLVQIKEHLVQRLRQLGRTDWHSESCQYAVEAAYVPKNPINEDNQWRIKGTGKLSSKEMAFLREIWYWRENIARETNIAPFMICRNEDMLKLSAWAARRRKPIEKEMTFPLRVKSSYRNALMKSLQKASSMSENKFPRPRKSDASKRLPDSMRRKVDQLKTECEKIARKHQLPLNLIASRTALTRIVLSEAPTKEEIIKKKILLNWQTNLLMPAIEKTLQ